ncbi:hypothetical protein [Halobacillus sp. A5]|uniref:hypothetical protein n=1 Tax=Halobacillus sp. A5 TaxID=2880263 RepID=UPI0020A6B4F2|nr:hypothetical protein [Halobacillus sp. A5]MCP3027757.1 hypothetical protein [Halobacillus sp. A5]
MRYKILSLFILPLLTILAGCTNEQTQSKEKETFPTEKAAFTHFIQNEKPGADIERVTTTEGDEFFVVRTGNEQYSLYGKTKEDNQYSVEKLTAAMSLHNTNSGGTEFTLSNGEEYTFMVAVERDGLNRTVKNEFQPILSEDAFLALSKGHTLDKANNGLSTNVIEAAETVHEGSSG